ncbi:uncharacterized protein LOC113554088 [Rhopalosiphum maidis]|uniref:uncharacterized protein LOC113554088 n=1 Tax=Rhopalosiphum maidis TaxID=43146 RepID=UPI000F00651C|nr:uncharacterized protein LOC113554088 [Rhopalosiphum maidis]XP_026813578.1 uncharacterized protein LOC113554088 [Rhopalosiphum maidis]XP_026813579.1 uncharacterized protein LOC113554088 [Rhopalosiphum maidis]XP_026813580.1 uncharacterized protein LOC113554088 [Rhopalosiphum maidis]XP_026813581.1 uncharacterized protein LOC113554088 [Rhopalosiphum maidis]
MTTPVFVSSRVRENASNNNGQFNRASQRIFITPAAAAAAPDTASTKGKTNHATTQANMNSADLMESDESKKLGPKNRSQQFYSKQDIVEQYCLSDKQLQVLNRVRQPPALFGCISSHRESSCGARSSPNLLTACVRRRIPSDENLQDLYKRLPADCAPYSRWSRYHHCHPDVFPVHHCHQSDLAEAPPPPLCQRSPAIRRHKCWPPEDEGCPHRTCHPTCHGRSGGFDCPEFHPCTPHYLPPPPPPPAPPQSTSRMRHVSFARSHTVTSFDNVSLKSANSSKSLERLIDGRKTPEPVCPVESPKIIVLEKIKRAQKVQATQTDCARDTGPATAHKIKSVTKKNVQQNEIPKSIIRPSEPPYSNEILIDFEPKDPPYRKQNKTILHKTVSDGEILIGEIARCRSREDVEASVSDGEQCYKNLVAASCTVEGSLEDFHENESILCEGIYKSKSSVCLSESPNKCRTKTPSSSNDQDPSDLSQTTVLQFENSSKKIKLKEDNLCDVVQKKIIRYTDLPLKSSDLIEQGNSQNTLENNCPTVVEPSEVSTSTEDYVTATDSTSYTTTPTQGPSVTSSSFDSESSKYSLPHPIFDHDMTIDPTDPIDEELGDGEDSSDDESSTSGRSIPKTKLKTLEESNKLNNPDLISSNRVTAKCHTDDTNSNLIKKLMGNGFATKISLPVYSSDESSKAPERRRRPSPRRKSIGAVTLINSIDKKPSVVNKPEKRRESLPEILRKPQINLDIMEKSKTEFNLEDKPKCLSQTKSSQINYLSQINNLNLKTVSAESLRSISPGSDSVFYSDPCSKISLSRCTRCNTEVDADYINNSNSDVINIVKPPEGFGDSPEEPPTTPIKRSTKRYRSEERRRNTRSEQTRAKSEERVKHINEKGRPMTRSTNVSMERLNGSSSSLHSDDDDWSGIYTTPFTSFSWVYIDEIEEFYVWKKPSDLPDIKCSPELKRRDSIESTCSEHEFRVKYQTITHRMVHRKSSLEMFKRIASKSFDSDERLMVKRESGEFGFRIHGAKPVVVSAIETGTAAENSGLQVGDIIISINDMCVLDASHSEFVNVAHSGSDVLELEVARTCDILTPVINPSEIENRIVIASKLWKFSIGTKKMKNCWQPRYFCLKTDNCLYYYKSASLKRDRHPLGALNLKGFTVMQTSDTGRMFSFRLERKDHKKTRLHIAANSAENADRWIGALNEATKCASMEWLNEDNLKSVVTIDPQSDCQGFLSTLVHHCGKSWKKYYCVLKGARLYFFVDSVTRFANGMACLHGYKVQSSVNASVRKFAFELIPPDLSFRYFYFYTDTEVDKRRWIAALEYSIDRWINVS